MQLEKHFLHRLESLRGVAALLVAVHHSLSMIQVEGAAGKINRGLQGIFYGHGAVICFFILSGLVLGQSIRRITNDRASNCLIFYLRRLLRIYPAFIMSICLCGTIFYCFSFWKSNSPAATQWYQDLYSFESSWSNFARNAVFLENSLNAVSWSLPVEIIGSLLLPLFHFASRTATLRALVFLCLFALQFIDSIPGSVLGAFTPYLWMFYLGYLIPLWPAFIRQCLEKHRHLLVFLLVVSSGICLSTHHFGHHSVPYAMAVGFVIAVIFHLPRDPVFRFLDQSLVKFFGRISYSFYLLHWPVVYVMAGIMFSTVPATLLIREPVMFSFGLAVLSVGVATPLSMLSFYFIEKPCISIGKALRRRDDPPMVPNPQS